MQETFTIRGDLDIKLLDSDGNIKDQRKIHNTVKNAGLYGLLDQALASPTLAKVGWMAVGTGSPAATLLGTETARVALDSKTRSNAVLTMVCTFPAGTGTGAITEAGLFDVVTANTVNMWCSSSFAAINKGASDVVVITWTLTIS
jgi:hypothetical protein